MSTRYNAFNADIHVLFIS